MTAPPPTPPRQHPNAKDSEVHESWVSVRFNKANVSPPGAKLVDSDIRHQRVVVMQVSEANRQRDLHTTWWHEEKQILQVVMSEAQFAAAITSFGDGSAKPATLWRRDGASVAQCLDEAGSAEIRQTIREVSTAAEDAVTRLAEEVAALNRLIDERASARAIREAARGLTHHVDNLPKNLAFAAQSLQKTVETVVTKARYDIEAVVEGRARALGIPVEQVTLELGVGDE